MGLIRSPFLLKATLSLALRLQQLVYSSLQSNRRQKRRIRQIPKEPAFVSWAELLLGIRLCRLVRPDERDGLPSILPIILKSEVVPLPSRSPLATIVIESPAVVPVPVTV